MAPLITSCVCINLAMKHEVICCGAFLVVLLNEYFKYVSN